MIVVTETAIARETAMTIGTGEIGIGTEIEREGVTEIEGKKLVMFVVKLRALSG